jgi:hypothetical protein
MQGRLDASRRRVERKRKPVCCLNSQDSMPTMPTTSPSKSVSLPDELVCEDNVIPKNIDSISPIARYYIKSGRQNSHE